MDQVGGAGASSAAELAKAQQAQRKEPTRSFQDVAKDRGRTDRKDDRDRDAAKERALREGKAGPKPGEADPYAAQLQERLLGGREGAAEFVEAEVQGELVQGEQVQGEQVHGEVIETAQRTDAAFGELRATAGAREEGALVFGRAQVDRSDKSMMLQKHDLGSTESSTRTTQTDVQERDVRTLERDTREVDEGTRGDDDLKSELDRHLFASEISNPLMAQRATEPKAVEAARPTAQISPQVIDKIVERARFGQLQGGGHEFQVDLKQDVFGGAELKVVTKDGQVSVEMVSDDPALHQAARQLGDQLKQKGLNVAEVRVMTKAEAQDALMASRGLGQAGSPRARSLYDDDDDLARRR